MVAVYTLYGLEGGALPPRPGVGLGGLVPRAASAVLGGLVLRTASAVLGGLPFTSADYCDFRTHGPRMRIDDPSAPSGRFVARVSTPVVAIDRCSYRGRALPAADNALASVFAVPTGIGEGYAEAPATATPVAQPTPSRSPTQGSDSVEPTGQPASAPAPSGSPMPPTKPSWDRISTRTRRPTATAASAAPPDVDYGFGPGGAPRPFARRANTPPRVLPAAAGPPTAATPAPAASSVPTVPIPSDRDRAEPVETPLLRLTPPLGDTPPAPGKLDALGHATKLQFADSVARYSQAVLERQQQAEPTCHATRRYILPFAQRTAFHRRMRIGAAHRKLSRNHKERFLAPDYA